MGRPFTASDEEILDAASRVIARRGPDAFSIAEVAADVGLSRAAIILRFKSTHALKVTLLEKMVEAFATDVQTVPQVPGGDNVLRLAGFLGGYIRSRDSLARFFSTYSTNIQHRDLLELELKRGEALRTAIANVMPGVAIDHQSAVTAFSAHLTGCIMAWLANDDQDSRAYLVTRTSEWLKLAGVPFSADVFQELSAPLAAPADGKRAARSARPKRTARATKRTHR
jgi:TetR/AcrR family macrolide resistance operon transcriptional repressor